MPSADFCGTVREDYSPLRPMPGHPQISRGQRSYRRCIDAGFIKYPPLWMEDFVVACPLVPNVPHLLSGSCPSPRTFVPRGRQTPPRGDALALPWSFGSTHTWTEDLPPSLTACTAHTLGFSRRWMRAAARRCWAACIRGACTLPGPARAYRSARVSAR
jgi:hypothetical protein